MGSIYFKHSYKLPWILNGNEHLPLNLQKLVFALNPGMFTTIILMSFWPTRWLCIFFGNKITHYGYNLLNLTTPSCIFVLTIDIFNVKQIIGLKINCSWRKYGNQNKLIIMGIFILSNSRCNKKKISIGGFCLSHFALY